MAGAVSTRSKITSYPARLNSLTASRASSTESSTIKRRSSAGILSVPQRSGFVQQQPIQTQLAHGLDELRKIDRLADVAVSAKRITVNKILFLFRRGQYHHGKKFCAFVRAYSLEHFEAVDFRKLEVEQGHARQLGDVAARERSCAEEKIQSFHAVAGDDHVILDVVFLQRPQRQFLVVGIVFHKQDNFVAHIPSFFFVKA